MTVSDMMQESEDSTPKECIVCLELFEAGRSLFCLVTSNWESPFTNIWQEKETFIWGPGFVLRLLHASTSMTAEMTDPPGYEFHVRDEETKAQWSSVSCFLSTIPRDTVSSWRQREGLYGPASPTSPSCISWWGMPRSGPGSPMLGLWFPNWLHMKISWAACQTENSKPHLRDSDCMGVMWALRVWIFASSPDQSWDQVAVRIPCPCLCIKHSAITGVRYRNYVPTERC